MNQITVGALKARMESGEKLHIIDVREPHEYAEFNIGAQLLPLGQIMAMQLDSIEDLRNEEVIVHCKAGVRSTQACMMLEQAGFTNVVNVAGGMDAWKKLDA